MKLPGLSRLFTRTRVAAVALLAVIAVALSFAGWTAWGAYHLRAAKRELAVYHVPLARTHIEKVLRVSPDSHDVHLLAGQAARRAGDYEVAERHYDRCQEIAGGPTEGVLLERLMSRAQRGEMESVAPALRDKVTKNDPAAILILEALTRGYIHTYRFNDALFALEQWQQRSPDDMQAMLFTGWVREQLGPRQEALDAYRTVVRRDPTNDEARLRLANLLLERSAPGEAVVHLEALSQRQPDNYAVKVRLARSWHDLGRLDDAGRLLDRILQDEPDYAPALTARGRLALQLSQVEAAETWLRRAHSLDKADFQALFLLNESLSRQDKQAEAADVRTKLAALEEDMRKINEIVTQKLAIKPDEPSLHVQAGEILLRVGDAREGLRWLYRALRFDPRHPPAHKALADYYEKTGDTRRAAHHREQARP